MNIENVLCELQSLSKTIAELKAQNAPVKAILQIMEKKRKLAIRYQKTKTYNK